MSKLDEFLNLRDVSEIREDVKIKVDGKDLVLGVRPLTESEHSDFQNRAYKMVGNKMMMNLPKYTKMVLDACIVEPNFHNPEFLKKAKCSTFEEFLDKKFPAGVLSDVMNAIQKLSGFDSYEMEIENAKN